MSELREKVARAILETDPTCNYDACKGVIEKGGRDADLQRNWWEGLHRQADAALSACGHAELVEEIERLRALTAWQPIETAPKDGENILTWSKHFCVISHWIPKNHFGTGESARWFPVTDPTHWLPLPSPPEKEGGS